VLVKLSAGSDPVSLNDTIVTFDTKNSSQTLSYEPNQSSVSTEPEFIVQYVKQVRTICQII